MMQIQSAETAKEILSISPAQKHR